MVPIHIIRYVLLAKEKCNHKIIDKIFGIMYKVLTNAYQSFHFHGIYGANDEEHAYDASK